MDEKGRKKFYEYLEEHCGTKDVSKFTKRGVIAKWHGGELKCICGQPNIINYYIIKHLESENEFNVGSCCVKKFGIKKRCPTCQEEHKNRLSAYCNKCRIKDNFLSKKINFGKYKNDNITWKQLIERDISYCKYLSEWQSFNYRDILLKCIE